MQHEEGRDGYSDSLRASQEVGWELGLDWSGSEYGQVAGSCECGNEPAGSI